MQEENQAAQSAGAVRRGVFWFAVYLAAMYFSVRMFTPWIAGRIHDGLPLLSPHGSNESRLQFFFSHLFAFSFVPAFVAGLMNYKYKHTAALFVWIPPTVILAYHFFSFPSNMFENHTAAAYHQYFAGGFILPEYSDYRDMFSLVAQNPDMVRGAEQFGFTAPFYAGIAYSVSSLLSMRLAISLSLKKAQARWSVGQES